MRVLRGDTRTVDRSSYRIKDTRAAALFEHLLSFDVLKAVEAWFVFCTIFATGSSLAEALA